MDGCMPMWLFLFVQRRYMDYIHILNDFKTTYIMIKIPQDSCDNISWLIYMINVEVSFNRHNSCKDVIYISMIRTRKFKCFIQGFNALICAVTWLNLQDSCKDMIKCIYDSGKATLKSILNRQNLYKDMVKSTWIMQIHDENIRLTQQYNWNYKTHEKTGLNLCD